MTIPRFHLDAPLAAGATVAGSAAQARHLGSVLRRTQGDAVRLFNAESGEYDATISTLRKEELRFAVGAQRRPPAGEPGPWLVFALLKRDATDWVVEKATELGAERLLPVVTARTQSDRVNLDRLRAIATAAAEQCERLSVPEVAAPAPLFNVIETWPADRRLFVAAERREAAPLAPAAPSALLVGPEGGFAPVELDALLRRPFVAPVSLGPRILRAETACLAGLARLGAPAP